MVVVVAELQVPLEALPAAQEAVATMVAVQEAVVQEIHQAPAQARAMLEAVV